MPRRRRPRCKVNPTLPARKKNPENSGPSRPKVEAPRPPPPPPPPLPPPPAVEEPPSEEPPELASTSSCADTLNDTDYRLFPEIYDRPPTLPTFADIFGQPTYGFGSQWEEITPSPSSALESGCSSITSCSGIQNTMDGTFSNIPATMLDDRFGMTGLLAAIRTTHTDPGATQLVFGEDLTTFGLDLAAQGDIYVHFNGPFTHDAPERSSMDCALELGMRAMRDAMVRYPPQPPDWDPFVPETADLGLAG
ncbi:hypothetical protein KR009_009134, partial [Drosophila setifemur]